MRRKLKAFGSHCDDVGGAGPLHSTWNAKIAKVKEGTSLATNATISVGVYSNPYFTNFISRRY